MGTRGRIAEDVEEQRRQGFELQARIPPPRWGRRKPRSARTTAAGHTVEAGYLAVEAGTHGLGVAAAIAAIGTAILLVTRRRRRRQN